MNRGIWIALALLVAAPAHALDDAKKPPAAGKAATTAKPKKAKPDEKKKGADAGGSAAWGTGAASKSSVASKQPATTSSAAAADRAAMLRARAVYRYAVESCVQGGRTCDTAMRDDAESNFIDSCLPCATREQCEAERDVIRAGNAKTTTALCGQ